MKTIIFLFFLVGNVYNVYADSIPGWIELDLNTGRYYDFYGDNKHNLGMAEVNIKYGGNIKSVNWFKPYMLVGWKTFFNYMPNNQKRNIPFRDNYSIGVGFVIKNFFYFEYEHKCSHAVYSKNNNGTQITYEGDSYLNFEGYPTVSYDMFKIGIKFKID